MYAKRLTPRHIIKMPKVKDKERILKEAREKLVTYRGVPLQLSADLQARRDWKDIFKVMKSRDL